MNNEKLPMEAPDPARAVALAAGVADSPGDVEQTNKSLLAQIRHELRTPVNAIIGYSEMLLEDAANLTHQRFFAEVQHVHSLGKQLLALLNAHLDSSKVEGATTDLNLHALGAGVRQELHIPANDVIDSCDSLLQQADEFGLHDFVPDLQRIREAGVSLFTLNDEVLDFGKRVPESAQLAGSAAMGTGPAEEEAADSGAQAGDWSCHVLVADDNAFNRDILARCLYRQGHHFALAQNGRQALDLIMTQAFDLVLLDIMMPEMNGIQVLEHMKADPELKHLPVIMMSSLDEIDSVVRCLQMGADDCLPRPFNPVMFRARINATLERKRLRDRERLLRDQLKQEQERGQVLLQFILTVLAGVGT